MSLETAVVLLGASVFLLYKSSDWVVRSLARISAYLGLSEFLVSFILMGFATSAPEVLVSALAAFRGDSIVALGNVLGSNILYPTLLVGLAALLARHIIVRPAVMRRENIYAAVIALLPFLFLLDLKLDRAEGAVLILLFLFYIYKLLNKKQIIRRIYGDENTDHVRQLTSFFKQLGLFIMGIGLLLASSEGFVRSTIFFAHELNLSLFFISIFVVAFGVALPELVFSLRAAIRGRQEMIIGNIFGSLVINSGLALGLAVVISPLFITNVSFLALSGGFAVFGLLLFALLALKRSALSWVDGSILIWVYILFVFSFTLIR